MGFASATTTLTSPTVTAGQRLATLFLSLALGLFCAQGLSFYLFVEIADLPQGVPPLQVILVTLAWLLFLISYRDFSVGTLFRRHPGYATVAAGIFLLSLGLAFGNDPSSQERNFPFQIVIGLILFHLGTFVVADERLLRLLLTVLFGVSAASSALALFEAASGSSMPWARGETIALDLGEGAQGLEWFPVAFGYSILFPAALAWTYFLNRDFRYARPAPLFTGALVLLSLPGLMAAGSRSGLLGLCVAIICIYLLRAKRQVNLGRYLKVALVVFPLTTILVLTLTDIVGKTELLYDPRLYATYAVYLPVVLVHPLGIPESEARDVITYIDAHRSLGLHLDEDTFLLGISIAPHNGFLTAGLKFGLWGLCGLLWIVGITIARLRRIIRFGHSVASPLAVALLAGTIALTTHVFFHNMSIFVGDMRNWFPLGLAAGLWCMALRSNYQRASR